jgi:hypothetical protein
MRHLPHAKPIGRNGGVAELLRQARAQPGVKAVMEVYRACEAIEKSARPYSQALLDKPLIGASDSSATLSW